MLRCFPEEEQNRNKPGGASGVFNVKIASENRAAAYLDDPGFVQLTDIISQFSEKASALQSQINGLLETSDEGVTLSVYFGENGEIEGGGTQSNGIYDLLLLNDDFSV